MFAASWAAYGTPERVQFEPRGLAPGKTAKLIYENRQLAGRTVYAHFGANGWNLPIGGAGAGSDNDQGNLNHFARRAMHFDASRGRYELTLTVPAGARAMHLTFCWDDCRGAASWDNNGQLDYSWPVVFPYIGPLLTWTERTPPASAVLVSFENSWIAPGWIEFGIAGRRPTRQTSPAGIAHRFELTGLQPDTRYSYRVGVGEAFASPVYTFKTAKSAKSANTQAATSFLVFGDAQDNGENGRFARVAEEMAVRHADAEFVLSTGDLPWNDKPGDWWSFFDKGRPLFATKVVMPAIGNHDTPTVDSHRDHASFTRYFPLPETTLDRPYYRFTVGAAEFYAMNSERPAELARGGAQYVWLEARLAARRRQLSQGLQGAWTFAYWHIPPFDAGTRHYGQQYAMRPVAGLFDDVVDWHFGGHEHIYQRMRPIRRAAGSPELMGHYGPTRDGGVGYLIVPAAGVPGGTSLVSVADRPELRERLAFPLLARDETVVRSEPGFTRVDLRGNAIDLKVYAVPERLTDTARLLDRVQYTKSPVEE